MTVAESQILNTVTPFFGDDQVKPHMVTICPKEEGFSIRGKEVLRCFTSPDLNVGLLDFEDGIYVRYELLKTEVAGKRHPAGTVILEILNEAPFKKALPPAGTPFLRLFTKSCGMAAKEGRLPSPEGNGISLKT
jgi:hypothetical protein